MKNVFNSKAVVVVAFPKGLTFEEAFDSKQLLRLSNGLNSPIQFSLKSLELLFADKTLGLAKAGENGIYFASLSEITEDLYEPTDTLETLFARLQEKDGLNEEDEKQCHCPACTVRRMLEAKMGGASEADIFNILTSGVDGFMDQLKAGIEKDKEEQAKPEEKPELTEAQQAIVDMAERIRNENYGSVPGLLRTSMFGKSVAGMGVTGILQRIMAERKAKRQELKRKCYGMRQVLETLQNAGTKQASVMKIDLQNKLKAHKNCGCPECMKKFEAQKPVLDGMMEAQKIMSNQGIHALATAVEAMEKEIEDLKLQINAPVQSATLDNGTTIHAASRLKKEEKVEEKEEVSDELPEDMPDFLKAFIRDLEEDGAEIKVIKL